MTGSALSGCSDAPPESLDRGDAGSGVDAGTLDAAPSAGGDDAGFALDATAHPSTPEAANAAAVLNLTEVLTSDDLAGRDEGSPGGLRAQQLLSEELERCGIPPLTGQSYAHPIQGGRGSNIIGRIAGADPTQSERHIILSAHFDHIGACPGGVCKGAVDNAAGAALVVGAACELAKVPPAKSILVVLFDAEEPPTFLTTQMGSIDFVRRPPIPLDSIDLAVVLDLIGGENWPGYSSHFVVGSETSPELEPVIRGVSPTPGLPLKFYGFHVIEEWPDGHQAWSDYDAFRNNQVPTILLSDAQNKNYHTPLDDFDHINPAKLALEGDYLVRLAWALANSPGRSSFHAGSSDLSEDAAAVAEVLSDALAPGGLVDSVARLPATRTRLERDLAAARQAQTELSSGTQPTAQHLRAIRLGAQRILCLAGNFYTEDTCTFYE